MHIEIHNINNIKIAEVTSDDIVIKTIEEGVDLLGNLYYQDCDSVILHEENITPDFFDLKTGIAGEILQKFTNYRVRLAIAGDFSKHNSKSLQNFIFESNKGKQVNFASSVEEAKTMLTKQQ